MSNKLTQDKIFDFMCQMSKQMMDENIPIVNNISHDLPNRIVKDNTEKEERKKNMPKISKESYYVENEN
mgnify:CR=1 FL=1